MSIDYNLKAILPTILSLRSKYFEGSDIAVLVENDVLIFRLIT